MFDWLGFKKGLPLWRSYRLNAGLKEDVENIFEGIAETRVQLLADWAGECWLHLERLRDQLDSVGDGSAGEGIKRLLAGTYSRAADFTEIFILDKPGAVVFSTYAPHIGVGYGEGSVLASGLNYARSDGKNGRPCLFGPYADPTTLAIGPRSSSFHDKMTLMFIFPIMKDGRWEGAIGARVPNDVIGDLIQRESGHVYPDSGDNYLFMAKAELNVHIVPGTALSRSRFEDRTFTHGENLKDGVTTDWGTVSVKEHTELELMFTDPATGQLHPA
ncbi:PDC sensor domain-containing protein [Cohnella faecalis]|uniref:PDC sensor domain-containing protein n=1 Tax=Cohnella faecalis TaxID=2315694 RepID=UPI0011C230C9|nr:cache domain-containing protein [Cohnella faecalis]